MTMTGNAEAEMSVASESISFHLNALKETWTGVAQTLFQRGDINAIIDGLTLISNGIKTLVDNFGLLGTIGAKFFNGSNVYTRILHYGADTSIYCLAVYKCQKG